MSKITQVYAHEILDSRGDPTIETVIRLDSGQTTVSSVPSGASVGAKEALELRDKDSRRFAGKGVLRAAENVNQKLGPALVGMDPANQTEVDQKLISLDGTKEKKNMGANAILSISQSVCKAGAIASGMSLYNWVSKLGEGMQALNSKLPTRIPTPVFNMINGGLHGAGNLDFQEFQVIPASSKIFSEGLRTSVEVYYQIRESLIRRGAIHSVGDEGGFAPNLFTNADALEIDIEAIKEAGYQIGEDFFLGLDVAANSIWKNGSYTIKDRSNALNGSGLESYYESINQEYRLIYLEDPYHEEDWNSWRELTAKIGDKTMVVGDDLLVTNPERVSRAVSEKACNAILVKPNQIGTVTETLGVIKLARNAGWKIIVSHRSGETNDWFIADFAVGVKSDYVKFGAPARGERIAKYNRLLAIEKELAATQQ
ncbi:MAG: phosphopyruvate hydratase [Candidatus Blackburnbacteria bacterium RIFCSPHIGHO2_01_FULL_43_15b]|uniref:Enolase n=1 Tax=Candidatus Blackburnbacteria bacterium RIFCSPHIGHO2_01_FULL_43_15b TaxID=1797513 RepID=A0A1G1V127_9BACT|nr:MAG: phosphopyruvate hydratase [Candidatus Blackburnbacteria bacterium RIFCSPHIGHO2_01_FULL_43_15b]